MTLRLPEQAFGLIRGELERNVTFELLEPARERVLTTSNEERPTWMERE
jgi:hypothetical protein